MNLSIGNLILTALLSYLFLMWFSLVVWVWNDVRQRTHDQVFYGIAMILVILGNIFGVAVYLVIRPRETFKEAYYTELEEKIIISQAKSLGIVDKEITYELKPERAKRGRPRKQEVSGNNVSSLAAKVTKKFA